MANGSGRSFRGRSQKEDGLTSENLSDGTADVPTAPRSQSIQLNENANNPSLPSQLFETGNKLIGRAIAKRYLIELRIGNGATGEVFLARDIDLDKRVALKLITPALTRNTNLMEGGNKEILLLAQIDHPAVVRYFANGHDEVHDVHWIAMDFVEGVPLSAALAAHTFTENDLLMLLEAMTGALQAIHGHGVIHCDISPDNIILRHGDPGQPVLIDFGIARLQQAWESQLTIVGGGFQGKLAYAAPETFGMYGGSTGPWTDIFGLGAVIYESVTGKRAFDQSNFVDAIDARKAIPDLRAVSPTFRAILYGMLEPDPHKRSLHVDPIVESLLPAPQPELTGGIVEWGAVPAEMVSRKHNETGLFGRLFGWLSMGGTHGPGGSEDD